MKKKSKRSRKSKKTKNNLRKSEWLSSSKKPIKYTENFQKILNFYLFNNPNAGTAVNAKTFSDFKWRHRYPVLKASLINLNGIEIKWNAVLQRDITDEFTKKNLINPRGKPHKNVLVFYKGNNECQFLIRHIRNSLAHGSFSITNNGLYYFEAKRDNVLKARLCISENVLLEWIKIIKKGPNDLK